MLTEIEKKSMGAETTSEGEIKMKETIIMRNRREEEISM